MTSGAPNAGPSADRRLEALIVDDEPVVREAIRRILESEGFRAAVAGDVRSALAHPAAASCGLLVCDLMLPDRSGIDLIRALRREDLPIVMITGYATPEKLAEALEAGVAEVLPKPFDTAELLAAVRRAVGSVHARR